MFNDDFTAVLSPHCTAIAMGRLGVRLRYTPFHLEEGPGLAWVNAYRVLVRGDVLGYARETEPTSVGIEDGAVVTRWDGAIHPALRLTTRLRVAGDLTLDTEFELEALASLTDAEVFVASYFSPNYASWFATRKHFLHDELAWVEKVNALHEPTTWTRDAPATQLVADGRWSVGHPPLWWTIGSWYAAPLTLQRFRYHPHAIATMARRDDALAIGGLTGYHNSHYVHLFGRPLAAGETAVATVRLQVIEGQDDVFDRALAAYQAFDTA